MPKIIKNNKYSFFALLSIISIFSVIIVLSPVFLRQIAQAVTGNYNRTPAQNTINVDDWNNLEDDFLLRDGSNKMQGDLNMGGHKITNLADGVADTDAATVKNVNDAIAGAGVSGGKDIFTNWGDDDCPGGTTKLYGGFAFSSPYNMTSGSSNPICMQSGDAGNNNTGAFPDKLNPIVTGANTNLPTNAIDPQSTISGDKIVKCSLCYKKTNACYEHYGSHNCAVGFSPTYKGYVLGSYTTNGGDNHYNSTQRSCVNMNFDGSSPAAGNMGAMWYGSKIGSNFGGLVPFTINSFIKCSLCCN